MKHLLTIAVAGIILFSSCTKFLARVAGVYRTPKKEKAANLIAYARSNGAKYDALYVVKSERDYVAIFKMIDNIPAVKIFNAEKMEVASLQGEHCPWSAAKTISVIDTMKQVGYTAGLNYDSLLNKLKMIDGMPGGEHKLQDYDNVIVFVWARFVPKLSKEMFRS